MSGIKIDLSTIIHEIRPGAKGLPIDTWSPALSGDIDIEIRSDGSWWHEGSLMQRRELVKLFASILRKEADGEYYLVTPVEKWRIRVVDLPLVAVTQLVEHEGTADQQVTLVSNLDDLVRLDAQHPLQGAELGESRLYVNVRQGLAMRISRPVYYQLVALGHERSWSEERTAYVISSAGSEFTLGFL